MENTKTLEDIMMDSNLSNVAKMIYSYICLATENNSVTLGYKGFEKMYTSIVTGDEKKAEECFKELTDAGLLKMSEKQEEGIIIYRVIKENRNI